MGIVGVSGNVRIRKIRRVGVADNRDTPVDSQGTKMATSS